MLPPITKKYEDHSTDTCFQFSFHCDMCGAVWESEQYPFSLRASPSISLGEQRAHALMWRAEHDAAYERANREALLRFSKCPKCGSRVCDDCFSGLKELCLQCQATEKNQLRK